MDRFAPFRFLLKFRSMITPIRYTKQSILEASNFTRSTLCLLVDKTNSFSSDFLGC